MKGKVVSVDFGGEPPRRDSKGEGVIVIQLRQDGSFRYRHRGSLSHIEKVGMLTMALHSMEFRAMTGEE